MYFWDNKRKLVLTVLGMLLLLGIVKIGFSFEGNRMLLSMNFCNDYEEIVQGKTEQTDMDIKNALKFNGCTVPYAIALNTFYISQDTSVGKWGGYFSTAPGYNVYFHVDQMWLDKELAIESNYKFSILIEKGEQYRIANLVVSGLPILALNEPTEMGKPLSITLLDEKEDTSYEGYCTCHMRGQTSAMFPKHGYKVELCDENLNLVKSPLLGLRNDDDWILNPLYGDSSKIREKLAYQIWADMQDYNQTKNLSSNITHVELIFDNIYWGIYGLQEPVDEKQLSFHENDIYYRKTDLTIPTEENFWVEDGQEYIPGFRIKYPNVEDIKAEDWLPLKPYVENFYYDMYEPPEEVADFETLIQLVDFENAMDYKIFLATIAGEDNIYKNINYCMRYEKGSYHMYMVPWDLNMSFGDVGIPPDAKYQKSYIESNMDSREYVTLYRAAPQLVEETIREKWKEYRKDFLSDEHLREMASSYMKELSKSGAMIRDNERWPGSNNSTDLSEINDYLQGHMKFLDEYFESTEWWRKDALLRGE